MVQFPQFRFRTLCIHLRMTASQPPGYPIRPSTDHRMFAPPRRFSQLTTAFLASIRQGIHRKPFSRLTILSFPGTKLSPLFQWSLPKANSLAETFGFQLPFPHVVTACLRPDATCQRTYELKFAGPMSVKLWARIELNYRPLPYQSSALTD